MFIQHPCFILWRGCFLVRLKKYESLHGRPIRSPFLSILQSWYDSEEMICRHKGRVFSWHKKWQINLLKMYVII